MWTLLYITVAVSRTLICKFAQYRFHRRLRIRAAGVWRFNLCQQRLKTSDVQILALTKEAFHNRSSKIFKTTIDQNQIERHVWNVPVPFCTMKFMNDGQYFPCIEASKMSDYLLCHLLPCPSIRQEHWMAQKTFSSPVFYQCRHWGILSTGTSFT